MPLYQFLLRLFPRRSGLASYAIAALLFSAPMQVTPAEGSSRAGTASSEVQFETVNLLTISPPQKKVPEDCDPDYRSGMEKSFRAVWARCQSIGSAEPSTCQRSLFSQCVQLGNALQEMEASTCQLMVQAARPLPGNAAHADNQKKTELSNASLNRDAYAAMMALADRLDLDARTLDAYQERRASSLSEATCSQSSAASLYKAVENELSGEIARARQLVSRLQATKEAAAAQLARNHGVSRAFAAGLRSAQAASASTITMGRDQGRAPADTVLQVSLGGREGVKTGLVPVSALQGPAPGPAVLKGVRVSPASLFQIAEARDLPASPVAVTEALAAAEETENLDAADTHASPPRTFYGSMRPASPAPNEEILIDGEPEAGSEASIPPATMATPAPRPAPPPLPPPAVKIPAAEPAPPVASEDIPLPPRRPAPSAPPRLPPAPVIADDVPGKDFLKRIGVTVTKDFTDRERAIIAAGLSRIPSCQYPLFRGYTIYVKNFRENGWLFAGGYSPDTGNTFLSKDHGGMNLQTVVHEAIHRLDSTRERLLRKYKPVLKEYRNCPVSQYGGTHPREDLAEAGRILLVGPSPPSGRGVDPSFLQWSRKRPGPCVDARIAAVGEILKCRR